MAAKNMGKRREGTAGVKTLIATASVAATIAGWAILPANDPVSAGATTQTQPAQTVPGPGTSDSGQLQVPPQAPDAQLPSQDLPQVDVPQGFQNRPSPFTNTHSSR